MTEIYSISPEEIPIIPNVTAAFTAGGEIQALEFTSDMRAISFTNFKAAVTNNFIQDVFSDICSVRSVFSKIDEDSHLRCGIIFMSNPRDVDYAIEGFKGKIVKRLADNKREELPSIAALVSEDKELVGRRTLKLKIEWMTGYLQDSIVLRYENDQFLNQAYNTIKQEGLVINGVRVCADKPTEDESAYVVKRKEKKELVLKDLPATIDEIDVEKALMEVELLNGLCYIEGKRSTKDEIGTSDKGHMLKSDQYIKSIYDKVVLGLNVDCKQVAKVECSTNSMKIKNFIGTFGGIDYKRRVDIDVYDIEIAEVIISAFNNSKRHCDITYNRTHCEYDFSSYFSLNTRTYEFLRTDIEALFNKLKEDNKDVKIVQKGNHKTQAEKPLAETHIIVQAPNPLVLQESLKAAEKVTKGEFLLIKNIQPNLKLKDISQKISAIENELEIRIEFEIKTGEAHLYGSVDNKTQAITKLKALLQTKAKYIEETKESLDSLSTESQSNEEKLPATCSICFCDTENEITFSTCGHKYCFTCIQAHLDEELQGVPRFPLYCPQCKGEQVNTAISISDLKQIFSGKAIESLFKKSFENYIKDHRQLFYKCPTPDCPQIFRNTGENKVRCDTCFVRYCNRCGEKWHTGDCDDVARVKLLAALKDYDCKPCPKCDMIIHKFEGCRKMRCRCNTIFCWLCTMTFKNDSEAYDHLNQIHQGVYDPAA